MNVISGRTSIASSPTPTLQLSLESRLRQRLDGSGCLMYALTWRTWEMKSGAPICVQRASVLRRLDKDYTGQRWPTPAARDYRDLSSSEAGYAAQRKRHQPSAITTGYLRGMRSTQIANLYHILMGYPDQWAQCMPLETPSFLRSRQSL